MKAQKIVLVVIWVICTSLLLPAAGWAQTAVTGAIAGVVRDTSGAVLPGVTVEAASPALIEKVRIAVTDGQGLYRIVDLRPGTYRVTFSLPGFASFVRDGIELQTAFTATVNAELRVGGLEETVTVSGAAPVVDTSNVISREVFSKTVVDALPVGQNVSAYATLIPAMRIGLGGGTSGVIGGPDVGGTQGELTSLVLSVHGGPSGIQMNFDGFESFRGAYSANRLSTQEVVLQTGGISAENETGGIWMNAVPREGGNQFSGSFAFDGATGALQSDNIDDALRARGVSQPPNVKRVYNVGGGLGGPIRQDKLWFFTAHRRWQTQQWVPDRYWNATQGTPFYTPDLSRPAHSDDYYQSHNVRLTWQAAPKHKVNLAYQYEDNCNCVVRLINEFRAPEATAHHTYTYHLPQGTWQYPATNRLLFEAGAAWHRSKGPIFYVPGVRDDDIAIFDVATGFGYNARDGGPTGTRGRGPRDLGHNASERFAVSYVTGTHNFKTGVLVQQWPAFNFFENNGGADYRFRNGVPIAVVLYASPDGRRDFGHNLGIYAQDQWTIRRLTLNLGLRFDRFRAYAKEQTLPAGPFVPERHFAKTDDLISFKDLEPRLGAAYDLFGDGKTAVKAFLGRYITNRGGSTGAANPAAQIVFSATRTWTDANGDFIPQANELGPLSDANFGNPRSATLTVDRDVRFGFGNRDHTWQGSISFQHELRSGLAVNVGYFRTWYGNFTFNDNLLVTGADFDEFCITAPVDARLPGGGGNQICGLYDVKPAKFGQVDTLQSLASDRRTRVFNGVDVTVNARFGQGGLLSGGLSTGNTVIDDCGAAVDSPQALRFCRTTLGWSDDLQFKVFGAYPLPWGLQTSGNFQSLQGAPIFATYVATGAEIAQGLGRTPSAGARATSTVQLIEPNTRFDDRMTVLDLRLSKRFRMRGVTATGNVDVSNVFNANPLSVINTQFGPQWLNGLFVLPGRLAKFGVQVEF